MPDWAVNVGIGGKDRGASSMFSDLSKKADAFGNHASAAFKKAEKSGFSLFHTFKQLVPVLSVAGVVEFSEKCIEAFDKLEEATILTRTVLKSTGQVAGKTFEDIKRGASDLSSRSIFGGVNIMRNVSNPLLSFTGIKGATFDRTQQAVLDLTSKMYGTAASGENLKKVTIGLGKILEYPAQGFKSLARYGIVFNKTQQDAIKLAYLSGNAEKARAMILAEVEKKAGGAARALTETTKGKELMRINMMNQAFATLGESLAPIKAALIDAFIAVMPEVIGIFKEIVPTIKRFGAIFKDDILPVIKVLIPWLPEIVIGFVAWKVAVKAMTALGFITEMMSWAKYLWMMREFLTIAAVKQWLLNIAMNANPIGLIVLGIAALITAGVLLYRNWDLVRDRFMKWTKIFDNPIFRIFAAILLPFITIPILIARHWNEIALAVGNAITRVKEFFGLNEDKSATEAVFKGMEDEINAKLHQQTNVILHNHNSAGVTSKTQVTGGNHVQVHDTGPQ